jgi:hypothetical protein
MNDWQLIHKDTCHVNKKKKSVEDTAEPPMPSRTPLSDYLD